MKSTTEKIEPSKQHIRLEMLTFQKRISNVNEDDNIPIDLVVNLDQTPTHIYHLENTHSMLLVPKLYSLKESISHPPFSGVKFFFYVKSK